MFSIKSITQKIYISIILISLFSVRVYGQTELSKEMFIEAESYFLFEEYKEALPLYQKIYRYEPSNYNVCYKIGICYLNDPYNKEKSIDYLKTACQHITPNYKLNSYRENQAPPEALFYLGIAYRKCGELDKAIASFNKFIEYADNELYDFVIIEEEIQACKNAIKLKENPVEVNKINNLGIINSNYAETNPIISGNGMVMAFVRKLPFYESVFISTKKDNNWTEPVNLVEFFGVDGNTYCTGISFNGDELYVYRSDEFDGNIYVSKKKKNKWSKIEKLGPTINTKYWESHASPSPDGKYLYFTSNRKGGYGGLDIYRAERIKDDSWGKAKNLGPTVNSRFDENTPFISPYNGNLYFSSLGHKSSGGYDIFISKPDDKANWSKPINIGYPLNTPDDELFYCPHPENEKGVFSHFDPYNTEGLMDIYTIHVTKKESEIEPITLIENIDSTDVESNRNGYILKGIISNISNNEEILNKLQSVVFAGNKKTTDSLRVSNDGLFEILLPLNAEELAITLNNEILYSQKLPVSSEINDSTVLLDNIVLSYPEKVLPKSYGRNKIVLLSESVLKVRNNQKAKIPLEAEKGENIEIDIMVDDTLTNKVKFIAKRNNPIYEFSPNSKKSTLIFKQISSTNDTISDTLIVYNTLTADDDSGSEPVIEPISEAITEHLKKLATNDLKTFLAKNTIPKTVTLPELYEYLLENSTANNYDTSDVDLLMAMMLTQKDASSFIAELQKTGFSIATMDSTDSDKTIPILAIKNERYSKNIKDAGSALNTSFYEMLNNRFDSIQETQRYLGSFQKYAGNVIIVKAENQDIKNIGSSVSDSMPYLAIDLAVSTSELTPFYHHLLFSSADSLKHVIASIPLKKSNIHNSIDLVVHLLKNSGKLGYSQADLLQLIEITSSSKEDNILSFITLLSDHAVGNIKNSLNDLKPHAHEFSSFQEVIYNLSVNSSKKGYSREELFKFLIGLSGITSIEDIKNYLKKTGNDEMAKSLENADASQFSNTYEAFQYLLASASNYAYTEWDICEVLSQLLLESDFKEKIVKSEDDKSGVFSADKVLTQILTLIGIALALTIILLIYLRSKKNKQ